MKSSILKKLLIIALIIMLSGTDFLMVGSSLISYAIDADNSTNNKNIEFLTYFKDEEGNKIENLSESIKTENLKLYAQIKVKNEGYLNGNIEIQNSNFKIKNNILSSHVISIEDNKVNLNQINAGEVVEIELDIEPIISDEITVDMLSKETTIKLTGTYMETTYKGLDIEAERIVKLTLDIDKESKAELTTEIITNKIFSINGENKRLVQLIISSKLAENQYPIKQTNIKVNIPELGGKEPEEIRVLSLGTKATNGKEDAVIENWKNEDGILEIMVENKPNEENKIKWEKEVEDEFVVTFIYNEDVDATKIEIETNSEIEIYESESKFTAKHMVGIENKELNSVVTSTAEIISAEIYKGKLYENSKNAEKIEIPFETLTTIETRTTGMVDKINVKEEKDVFTTENTILAANTKFISTEINKEKMLEILGKDGKIQIKNGDIEYIITENTEADENGNIVIKYADILSELEIIISNPIKSGKLEFKHSKAIIGDNYTSEQIRTLKQIKSSNTIVATLNEQKIVENTTEAMIDLKETMTKAELMINKSSLSTMTPNNNFILGIKMLTSDFKYDLYKNPSIKVQLPSSIEDIQINSFDKLYGDEFEIEKALYNKAERTIEIVLKGEQLKYSETEATQLYLQINFNIILAKTEPTKIETIKMQYINENATKYEGDTEVGLIEKNIEIVSPSGLVTINNIKTYNVEGISGISNAKQSAPITRGDAGRNISFDIGLINNTGSDIKNINILGKLPTEGNTIAGEKENTLKTQLKEMIANSKIYYSENTNATQDLENPNNGWTSNLSELANPRVYLLQIDHMPVASTFIATYTSQLENQIVSNTVSYSDYIVTYDTETEVAVKTESTQVGLEAPTEVKMQTNIKATVGKDELKAGDIVKAGEVIKYIASVTNKGAHDINNVTLKAAVPEGTVVVVPVDDYVYSGYTYYDEKSDIKEMTLPIEILKSGETKILEYEVRVQNNITDGIEISNKSVALCEETALQSPEFKNKLTESKVRVTIKRVTDLESEIIAGDIIEYNVFVENLSQEVIKDLKLKLITEDNFLIQTIYNSETVVTGNSEIPTISEIPANGVIGFIVGGTIKQNLKEYDIAAILEDSVGNKYRSNVLAQEAKVSEAKVYLESSQAGDYLTDKDEIIYKITVENTGSLQAEVRAVSNIPEEVVITELIVKDKIQFQTVDNSNTETYLDKIPNTIDTAIDLAAGDKGDIIVKGYVKELGKDFETKTVYVKADVHTFGQYRDTSNQIVNTFVKSTENLESAISGIVWLDENMNGQKDANESTMSGITVKLYDVSKSDYAKNEEGNIIETKTNENGIYAFSDIKEGEYIVLFEYDTTIYEPTIYQKEGVSTNNNSKALLKDITIQGQTKRYAVTDVLNVNGNISNINVGLKEIKIFDLELNKYISRIVVQNQKGTRSYDYKDSVFQKVEIHSKQLKSSTVIIEYSIKVKNNGEVAGFASNIVDYLPDGLTFSSELNPNWYLSGNNLYSKGLANEKINPGEEKELKLILTKTMTEDNTGLINNRAELAETYNEYGLKDINSTENNQAKGENDLGSADLIIIPSTGGRTMIYVILISINAVLIGMAIYLIMKNSKRKSIL